MMGPPPPRAPRPSPPGPPSRVPLAPWPRQPYPYGISALSRSGISAIPTS